MSLEPSHLAVDDGPLTIGAPPPTVLAVDEEAEVAGPTGPVHLKLHEQFNGWTLMACLELRGERTAVLEQHATGAAQRRRGQVFEGTENAPYQCPRIAYVAPGRVHLELAKSLVPTRIDETLCYNGNPKETVLGVTSDILRAQVLQGFEDAEPEQVARLFPPVRRARSGPFEHLHTFVGSPGCYDVVPVHYNPTHSQPRVNPLAVSPEIAGPIENEDIFEGLVGGWLPAVCIGYPLEEGARWESLTFGVPDAPSIHLQPVWYRYVKVENGVLREVHYFDSEIPYPWPEEPPAEAFYRALAELHRYWHDRLKAGMQVEVPEKWVVDFCLHSMALEMITRFGDHPRYGVADRAYGGPEHDGFQDILTSAVTCYSEWGHLEVAERYLDEYFTDFVRPDGSLRYRGPEIGQYGRMLTVIARLYDLSRDGSLLVRHRQKIGAIAEVLLSRREQALLKPGDDPGFGLIAGRHEADISFCTPTLSTHDYEQPYFSNSTEAWRGLRDLGRAWRRLGLEHGDVGLVAQGERLTMEAEALDRDLKCAIGRSWVDRNGTRTLPLFAGSRKLHLDAPYRSCPEAFDENRVWSEMLYSGTLDRDTVEAILGAAATHGDSTLGIFGNRKLVVAFTACGEAHGMIQHDLIREFLLLYYAHAFHLHTRGTWTAFECVDMDRDRAEHLPYCAPAQLTIPILTKWMLVFEDPVTFHVWLAKAVPRRWLKSGARVRVAASPTRWGPVSYEIRSGPEPRRLEATVDLPDGRDAPVNLRLRVPGRRPIQSVQLDGRRWEHFNRSTEFIVLPEDISGQVSVTVRY